MTLMKTKKILGFAQGLMQGWAKGWVVFGAG